MAVVKAEAYGHGTYEIATHINKIGVKAFAVATIDEGITLRKYGITGEILIWVILHLKEQKNFVSITLYKH